MPTLLGSAFEMLKGVKMDYCWGRLYNVLVKNTPSSDEQWVKDLVQLYNERYSGKI